MGWNEKSLEIESQMVARARQKTLRTTSWFSHAELAKVISVSSPEIDASLHAWRETKMIFSVEHEGVELLPAYAFIDGKPQLIKGLQAVLMMFAGKKDGWGTAYWFTSASGYLGGKRPQDVLLTNPEERLRMS